MQDRMDTDTLGATTAPIDMVTWDLDMVTAVIVPFGLGLVTMVTGDPVTVVTGDTLTRRLP